MDKHNKTKANTQIQRTEQGLPEWKWGQGEGKMGKGGQLYSDGWKLNFWWYVIVYTEVEI